MSTREAWSAGSGGGLARLWLPAVAVVSAAALLRPGAAAEPRPLLYYDFGRAKDGTVPEMGGSGLDLALGPKARANAAACGVALEFDGADARLAAGDAAQFKAWKRRISTRELAAAVWIRFDSTKPSEKASLGLFDCRLDATHHVRLRLAAQPHSREGPAYAIRSRTPLKPEEWHHVAFSYSQNKRHAALYVDGCLQAENNNLVLPELALGELVFGADFRGAIADFRLYDVALDSESLAPVTVPPADATEQIRILTDARQRFTNRYFDAWCQALTRQVEAATQASSRTTITRWRRLRMDISNVAALAEGLATNRNAVTAGKVTAFVVPAISQEIRMPYSLPADGEFSNRIQVAVALGEYEPVSFVVLPFEPVQRFEIRVSDLKSGASTIPAAAVDAKLVKRWFRCGGAWLSYHADKGQRVLVPDLLLNDENLMEVDEARQVNRLRLSYADGVVYRDISQYSSSGDPSFDCLAEPVRDAPTLQPVVLPEAGRSQQFWLTIHVPEEAVPGLYDGVVQLLADGQEASDLKLELRVLPFALPEACTYYDPQRPFFGQLFNPLSKYMSNGDPALAEQHKRVDLQNMRAHNMLYPNGPSLQEEGERAFIRELELRKEVGLPVRPLFTGHSGDRVWGRIPYKERTDEALRQCRTLFAREARHLLDLVEKHAGHREVYFYGNDEAGGYVGLIAQQEHSWETVKRLGGMTRAAGWYDNFRFMADLQDMHSITSIDKQHAELWHAVGGRLLNYADPFASSENPLWFRRKMGMMMYLANYDGAMLLSFYNARVPWNEFAADPGGDGNYRNFSMVYAKVDGVIDTLAWEGLREGFDDIRYATLLKRQALKHRDSSDRALAREARRQLAWLAQIDGNAGDLDSLRLAMIDRILTLRTIETAKGGRQP